MTNRSRFSRSQRMTIVTGILWLVTIIVILQIWLLTATMLWPAALVSLVCLGLNAGLLWYLNRLER